MKLKGFFIIIPLAFILITLAFILNITGTSPESMLFKAFTESGAEIVSSEITFTGKDEGNLKAANEVKRFYIEISEAIGANMPIMPETIDNESFVGIGINNSNGKFLNYNLKILESKLESDNGKCYVTLYIVDGSKAPELTDIKSKVEAVFGKFGVKASVNTCLTGRYPGRLDSSKMNEICTGIFKRTYARKVDGIRENNLISVSAYSRSMSESIAVNGKDVNLNFAARYNSYEDKTYIWLATPLITTEY